MRPGLLIFSDLSSHFFVNLDYISFEALSFGALSFETTLFRRLPLPRLFFVFKTCKFFLAQKTLEVQTKNLILGFSFQ